MDGEQGGWLFETGPGDGHVVQLDNQDVEAAVVSLSEHEQYLGAGFSNTGAGAGEAPGGHDYASQRRHPPIPVHREGSEFEWGGVRWRSSPWASHRR
ncbi:hypothetical protein [Tessaracoccus antarcticus]|uniref:Uncharacterized protein n=1 Tax=Tessaracoccus antarcticus TaxID=2479848 RepID=A0A3M0GKS1_9ACTN|nr:hypothetical protein [Tessaracoccus antarcticus]RMB62213.1 hypothetical protein EAX62_06525 [Tessaracoccus antarcticus]